MQRIPLHLRLLTGLCLALPFGLSFPASAHASWSVGGPGTASSLADTMPSGNQPTAVLSGTSVTLTWATASLPGVHPVAGYVIERINASTGAPVAAGPNCGGTITTTTCTESSVPAGRWDWTDTPVQHNWTGGQSPASGPVTVP